MNTSTAPSRIWPHRLAVLTATVAFGLLFLGGLVTSHSAGLSVPDWPTSYGWNMFTFPMKNWTGGIFYEHTHRLLASFVGFLILVQAFVLHRYEPRPLVRRLGWLALAGVIVQGTLGGLTVLFYLPPAISSSHAGLGQAVFCLTLTIALMTNRRWNDARPKRVEPIRFGLRDLSLATAITIFCQLLVGAVMRHTDSGLAIPTFPFAPNGSLIPDFTSFHVAIHFAHRVGAVIVTLMVFWTARTAMKYYLRDKAIAYLMLLAMFLLGLQIMLGAITIWTAKAVTPATLHVSCGAALLGTMVLVMVLTRHRYVAAGRVPTSASVAPAH